MEYFGIDASSKAIHIVFLDTSGRPETFSVLVSSKKTQDERFYALSKEFDDLVFPQDIFGAVEKPLFIQSAPATIGLAQVDGAIKLSLFNKEIPFVMVGVTTWKKVVVGKGNAKKEQVKQFVIDTFKMQEDLDQNFCDALCVARYAYLYRNSTEYTGVLFNENGSSVQ